MKKQLTYILSLAFLTVITSSCTQYASEKNLDQIAISMSKEEVMRRMDVNGVARGSIINKYGQTIEVREYKVDAGKSAEQNRREIGLTIGTLGLGAPIFFSSGDIIDTYWLYFCDGKLAQWGRAGDWMEAQRTIYDINFKVSKD